MSGGGWALALNSYLFFVFFSGISLNSSLYILVSFTRPWMGEPSLPLETERQNWGGFVSVKRRQMTKKKEKELGQEDIKVGQALPT